MIGTARFLRPRSRFPVLALQRWLSEDSSAKKISRNLLKAKPNKRGTRTWVSRCRGCGGALFSPHVPINVEGESWDGLHRASNSEGSTRADICARCQLLRGGHLLKALEASNELDPTTFVNMLRPLHDMTVGAVMVVSAIDFEGTYIESIRELIGKNPLILAVTKIDLICNTSNLKNVEILRRYFRSRAAAMKFSVLDVVPVSGVTGVGVDNLKSLLENTGIFKTADVYIVGAANVGKSTLVNCLKERFLGNPPRKRGAFAAEKNMESVDLTTSSLPGTTLALTKVGLLAKQNALYDTPGILKNMYRHPSTKENLHQIKRLASVALSVELNNTIVIGDDVLHVDLVSLERSLDAINTATSIVWRSVSKQTVKVGRHSRSVRKRCSSKLRQGGRLVFCDEFCSCERSLPNIRLWSIETLVADS
uniref:G domain-containing protein n=2 Tax=Rhodosorus marinus TaxID=101924 RepID=A0A7S3ENP6_9RHOD|mmetsp:Transcript_8809/g.39124  ORF Transcript_8809/g.39124 Transcript_8809/m.39124 type:complete len:422 (+) Transcript_8809:519-1784(+)